MYKDPLRHIYTYKQKWQATIEANLRPPRNHNYSQTDPPKKIKCLKHRIIDETTIQENSPKQPAVQHQFHK